MKSQFSVTVRGGVDFDGSSMPSTQFISRKHLHALALKKGSPSLFWLISLILTLGIRYLELLSDWTVYPSERGLWDKDRRLTQSVSGKNT